MKCPHCDGTGELENITFGALIIARRKLAGMTQAELAEKAVITRGQIANIETDRSDIPLKTLARIADALGCSMKDLVP